MIYMIYIYKAAEQESSQKCCIIILSYIALQLLQSRSFAFLRIPLQDLGKEVMWTFALSSVQLPFENLLMATIPRTLFGFHLSGHCNALVRRGLEVSYELFFV